MILQNGNVERICNNAAEIEKLKANGYLPLDVPEKDSGKPISDLEEMSLSELKVLAKEKGLGGYSSLTKEQLLEVLKDVVK